MRPFDEQPSELRSGRSIASTAYDTAWVASLPSPTDARQPRFPSALAWLLDHQLEDGSWGGTIAYQHDRIISTLSALRTLSRYMQRPECASAITRGQGYIWRHAHTLRHEAAELVGFELLLPTLAHEVERSGIRLPAYLDSYTEERRRKLALIPPDLIYSPHITLCHSLEFLGSDVDQTRLAAAQRENGSIGNSPAATAFLLQYGENEAALRYLGECLAADGGSAAPVLHPCETFDRLWSAYHRLLGGTLPTRLLTPAEVELLRQGLDGDGVSLSSTFPIPDADDTAVAIILLRALGLRPSFHALEAFERSDCYASFSYERHPSPGVNVHVLDAIKLMLPSPARDARICKVVDFLWESRRHNTYWVDKWHISPYYATAHALLAFEGLVAPPSHQQKLRSMIDVSLEWIRQTQQPDGSWGFFDEPTAEETAFALLALSRWQRRTGAADRHQLLRGLTYLRRSRNNPHPPLWIDKCLYMPHNIVSAVIDSALQAARAHTAELRFALDTVVV
jgi:halimadienyl-diphosphate synthase